MLASSPGSAHDGRPVPRPPSVAAATVIMYCLAGLALLGCCAIGVIAGNHGSARPTAVLWVLAAVLLGSAVLNGVLGYQVGRGRQWARITALVLNSVGILISVVSLVRGSASGCLSLSLDLVIVVLLSTEPAREYFRASG
jgi:hypothetical protein